jgi:superfamily I DNA/RNA helicase
MNLNDLNQKQREAVLHKDGPLLIVAGAGSGKTRAMTYRIAYLMEQGVAPYNILALTFTNKAAKEMQRRVEELSGSASEEAWIGTFHAICVRILRRDIEKLGYQRSFVIYDDDDQQRVLKDLFKRFEIDEKQLSLREMKHIIGDGFASRTRTAAAKQFMTYSLSTTSGSAAPTRWILMTCSTRPCSCWWTIRRYWTITAAALCMSMWMNIRIPTWLSTPLSNC